MLLSRLLYIYKDGFWKCPHDKQYAVLGSLWLYEGSWLVLVFDLGFPHMH